MTISTPRRNASAAPISSVSCTCHVRREAKLQNRHTTGLHITATFYAEALSRRQLKTPTSFPRSLSQRQRKLQRRPKAVSELNEHYHRAQHPLLPSGAPSDNQDHLGTTRGEAPEAAHHGFAFSNTTSTQAQTPTSYARSLSRRQPTTPTSLRSTPVSTAR